jgi:hypothetical protein
MPDFVELNAETLDGQAIASTESGDIYGSPGLLLLAPPDLAWQGMSELHQRSLGVEMPELALGELGADEAFQQWSNTLLGVMGQIGATDWQAGATLLDSMSDHVERQGNLDGLEAPYLAAFASAARGDSDSIEVQRANSLLNELGIPGTLGGGAETAPILDIGARALSFVGHDALHQVLQPNRGRPAEQTLSDVRDLANGALGGNPSAPTTASPAEANFARSVASAITGASAGGALGSVAGPIGTVLGAIAGFFVGLASGSDDGPRPTPTTEHATGDKVVVNNITVVNYNENPIIVNGNGNVVNVSAPAPSTANVTPVPDSSTTAAPQRQCPAPEPLKCPRSDDDYRLSPDFTVPYWSDTAVFAPTMLPSGPGTDAFAAPDTTGAFELLELPHIDPLGVLEAPEYFEALEPDRTTPTDPATATGGELRITKPPRLLVEVRTRMSELQVPHNAPLSTVIDALRRGDPAS